MLYDAEWLRTKSYHGFSIGKDLNPDLIKISGIELGKALIDNDETLAIQKDCPCFLLNCQKIHSINSNDLSAN